MKNSRFLRAPLVYLTFSGFLTPTLASPLQSRAEAAVNCTDPGAVFDSSCWAQLGVSDFLNNPKTGWNVTTKTCSQSSGDGSDCCVIGELWSTCFLRLALGPGEDCSIISTNSCTDEGRLSSTIPQAVAPQYRYVVWAITGELSCSVWQRRRLTCVT